MKLASLMNQGPGHRPNLRKRMSFPEDERSCRQGAHSRSLVMGLYCSEVSCASSLDRLFDLVPRCSHLAMPHFVPLHLCELLTPRPCPPILAHAVKRLDGGERNSDLQHGCLMVLVYHSSVLPMR